MNQHGRLWMPVCIGATVLMLAAPQAHAIVDGLSVGGGISIRQEDQEDRTDFRPTVDLYASEGGGDDPYWGYLTVSKELLMTPNVGRAVFSMVLVTPDGKPITEARWSEDPSVGYGGWQPMELVNGRWLLTYPLNGARAGTKTIYFAGRVRKGKGSYMKLLFITIGGRKDLRQADALQFMVYRLPRGIDAGDPETLIQAQEAMGAGGKGLIALGPRDRRRAEIDPEPPVAEVPAPPVPEEPVQAAPAPAAPARVVPAPPAAPTSAAPAPAKPQAEPRVVTAAAAPAAPRVPQVKPAADVVVVQIRPVANVRPASRPVSASRTTVRKPIAQRAPVKPAPRPAPAAQLAKNTPVRSN